MKLTAFLLFISLSILASAQLSVIVSSTPEDTPAGEDIFLAGNVNSWDPGNSSYILEPFGTDSLILTFSPDPGIIEFKFTRGSWSTVEGNEFGGYLPNRIHNYSGGSDTIICEILTWEDVGGPTSTAAWNVEIISNDFYIPQLDTDRRIWIYLPPDYYTDTKSYKTIYMHDGQNVFDQSTSFAGEWEVDETLNTLFDDGDEGCIVVAIDNGGVDRLEEYSAWAIPSYGVSGKGEYYLEFIVETLKPYIDENYRTKSDRTNTGLIGSSMGALISHYGGFTHSETFSRLGLFSPSYWITDSCFWLVETSSIDLPMRIYSIGGALEGSDMTGNINLMESEFDDAGLTSEEHISIIHSDGQHSEWYWAREFGDAYTWLWDETTSISDEYTYSGPIIYPNPASDWLQISQLTAKEIEHIIIYDLKGTQVLSIREISNGIDVSHLSGLFMVNVIYKDQSNELNSILIQER